MRYDSSCDLARAEAGENACQPARRVGFTPQSPMSPGVCAGYPQIAEIVDMAAVEKVLPDVEAHARELRATKRNSVKHNRGTHIFEAGNGP
jgi:hypothetical protein